MHVRRLPLENQIMVSGGEGIGSFKRVKKKVTLNPLTYWVIWPPFPSRATILYIGGFSATILRSPPCWFPREPQLSGNCCFKPSSGLPFHNGKWYRPTL